MEKRWQVLIILYVIRTAMGIQFQSIASVSPLLMEEMSINYAQLGMLIGVYQLPGVILAFPGGHLGKRFGDKRVLTSSLTLMALGGSLIGLCKTYELAILGRLISGVGCIILSITLTKVVSDWFDGYEIVTAMAIFVSSWPLGISLALVSLVRIALYTSWQVVMYLTAAISLIFIAITTVLYQEPESKAINNKGESVKQSISKKEVWLVLLAGLIWSLFNVGFVILPSFTPEFLVSKGYSVALASSLVSTITWIVILTLMFGGYIAERIGRPNIILLVFFSSIGTAFLLLTKFSNPMIIFIILGLLFGPPAGLIMALPNEVLLPENRGPGMGVFYTSYYAGTATLPAMAGFLQDITENSGAPFIFGGTLFFIKMLILGLFRYSQNKHRKI